MLSTLADCFSRYCPPQELAKSKDAHRRSPRPHALLSLHQYREWMGQYADPMTAHPPVLLTNFLARLL
jgi:hypothetical protein